jgi:hypothetical protein
MQYAFLISAIRVKINMLYACLTLEFLMKTVFCNMTFILIWYMHIQKNNITLTTYCYYIHLVTNKLCPLNRWYDSLMHEKANPLAMQHSLFHKK